MEIKNKNCFDPKIIKNLDHQIIIKNQENLIVSQFIKDWGSVELKRYIRYPYKNGYFVDWLRSVGTLSNIILYFHKTINYKNLHFVDEFITTDTIKKVFKFLDKLNTSIILTIVMDDLLFTEELYLIVKEANKRNWLFIITCNYHLTNNFIELLLNNIQPKLIFLKIEKENFSAIQLKNTINKIYHYMDICLCINDESLDIKKICNLENKKIFVKTSSYNIIPSINRDNVFFTGLYIYSNGYLETFVDKYLQLSVEDTTFHPDDILGMKCFKLDNVTEEDCLL